jgi:hypothetical protein
VIVRILKDTFLLIRQHEHGRISGEFARHWGKEILPEIPTLFAVTNHDAGWEELDAEVRFNPETDEPYSFANYPLEPKLRAYKHGLDQLEVQEPYAAYLCSMHYSSFVRDSLETAAEDFRRGERRRREHLEERLSGEWLAHSEYNFRLLRLCDDFSLFVCLNEPGENTFPWYRNGFDFMGQRLIPTWQDRETLGISPNPFSEAFDFSIPYELVGNDGAARGDGEFHIQIAA